MRFRSLSITLGITSILASFVLTSLEAQSLPDRILVGYWHNWTAPNALKLTAIPAEYDVVNIAFATPTTLYGSTMRFTPAPGIYATRQAFINDVQWLQNRGKKVLVSIGGGNDPVQLKSASDVHNFVTSMLQIVKTHGFDGMDIDLEGASLSLQAGDRDFRAPTSPLIVNFISAVNQLLNQAPPGFLLTAAPETAFVQGGAAAYAGIWGAYLPVLHALRHRLTYVHVQHYNTGTMPGRDGKNYTPATADFHVAMADMLIAGFKVSGGIVFPPLKPDQVAIGLPASTSAAGSGYTPPAVVHTALDYLYLGKPFAGKYTLASPNGYPRFRGLMTWSINWDVQNNLQFSKSHRAYLDSVFLKTDVASIPAAKGGTANFTLRAGKGNANRRYFLVASLSGTRPGTLLPGGLATLPLNLDPLSFLVLTGAAGSIFQNFAGTLDASGDAPARLVLWPIPGFTGATAHFAYALDSPWNFVSNPVQIGITP